MTTTIEQSVDVEVPVRTAYNQWTQFEEFPGFMEGVEHVTQIDDTPAGPVYVPERVPTTGDGSSQPYTEKEE